MKNFVVISFCSNCSGKLLFSEQTVEILKFEKLAAITTDQNMKITLTLPRLFGYVKQARYYVTREEGVSWNWHQTSPPKPRNSNVVNR